MRPKLRHLYVAVALSTSVMLFAGCRTSTPYVGDVSRPAVDQRADQKPLPIQLIVDAPAKSTRTVSRNSLRQAFTLGLQETGMFTEVSLPGGARDATLTRLYADVDMDVMMYCSTPPWYAVSWAMIWPMFVPWNEISAAGDASATVRDEGHVIKTYSAQADKQLTGRRNSVGLAYVRTHMSTWAPWAAPVATNLLGELIQRIVEDRTTFERALQE